MQLKGLNMQTVSLSQFIFLTLTRKNITLNKVKEEPRNTQKI